MCHVCVPRTTARRKAEPGPLPVSDDAQKKFGGAKAISSDMYFGKEDNTEVTSNYTVVPLCVCYSGSVESCCNVMY